MGRERSRAQESQGFEDLSRRHAQRDRQVLAKGLPGNEISTATLDQPQHGLDAARLGATDVLVWWGHLAHDKVADVVVEAIAQRVLDGMG